MGDAAGEENSQAKAISGRVNSGLGIGSGPKSSACCSLFSPSLFPSHFAFPPSPLPLAIGANNPGGCGGVCFGMEMEVFVCCCRCSRLLGGAARDGAIDAGVMLSVQATVHPQLLTPQEMPVCFSDMVGESPTGNWQYGHGTDGVDSPAAAAQHWGEGGSSLPPLASPPISVLGALESFLPISSLNLCSSASVKCLWCWVVLNNANFIPAALLVLKNTVAEKEKSTSAGSTVFEREMSEKQWGAGLKR